jgi:hypothetical protein
MRKIQFAAIALFGALIFAGAPLAHAQDVTKAHVPFAFQVGGRTLPAGVYQVHADSTDTSLIQIVSEDGRHSVFAVVRSGDSYSRSSRCSFEFHKIGDQYFLTAIDDPNGQVREIDLPASAAAAERALRASAERSGPERR